MKFLLNENIPPSLAHHLLSIGHESIHNYDCGLTGKTDEEVIRFASNNDLIILTLDLDYGRIISLSGQSKPSVITFRYKVVSPDILFECLIKILPEMTNVLVSGALISVDENIVRYRLLPLKRD